jgi:hypothetical protein
MASRFTLDTNILRIRDVFAFNPSNADFIQPLQIPIMGNKGQLKWYSSIELLSSISVPTTNTNVLDLLQQIQPGLSSISTYIGEGDFVTQATLDETVTQLSFTYKYISNTTLYDCFVNLGDMQVIGNELGPMITGSNLSGGYVSTVNPGEYRTYYSTVDNTGVNIMAHDVANTGSNYSTAIFSLAGYSAKRLPYSKMSVDIHTNMNVNFYDGICDTWTISSFLLNQATGAIVGRPEVADFPPNYSNANIGSVKFFLNSNDLTPFPNVVRLCHRITTPIDSNCDLSTGVPRKNGIFVTLDNTD